MDSIKYSGLSDRIWFECWSVPVIFTEIFHGFSVSLVTFPKLTAMCSHIQISFSSS